MAYELPDKEAARLLWEAFAVVWTGCGEKAPPAWDALTAQQQEAIGHLLLVVRHPETSWDHHIVYWEDKLRVARP